MFYLGILWKIIIYIIFLFTCILIYKRCKKIEKSIIYLCFFIYLSIVAEIVFSPIMFDMPISEFVFEYNIIPFHTLNEMAQYGASIFIKQVIGNIILFIPMGFLIPILYKRMNNFWHIIVLGLCCSFAIEVIQGLINITTHVYNRSVDIDDILLNVLGACIGYIVLIIFRLFIEKCMPSIKWIFGVENEET